MNSKIILVGTLALSILFFVVFFALLNQRQQQITNSLENYSSPLNERVFKANIEDLSPEARTAALTETYSLNILLRGTVISVNNQNNLLSLLTIRRDNAGSEVEEIRDLNFSQAEKVLCWPESMETANGDKIDIKGAFFPLEKDSTLFLNNQKIATFSQINQDLVGKFVFAYLTDTEFPKDSNPLIKELAILNCP